MDRTKCFAYALTTQFITMDTYINNLLDWSLDNSLIDEEEYMHLNCQKYKFNCTLSHILDGDAIYPDEEHKKISSLSNDLLDEMSSDNLEVSLYINDEAKVCFYVINSVVNISNIAYEVGDEELPDYKSKKEVIQLFDIMSSEFKIKFKMGNRVLSYDNNYFFEAV